MSWDGLKKIVTTLGASPPTDDLVLRGSCAMRVWFGDEARDPRDVDFVLNDLTVEMGDAEAERIVRAVGALLGAPDELEPIDNYPFTYGWHFKYGENALDLAFGEELREPPESIEVDGVRLNVVSRAESLAWKLRWLVAESDKEPKDLYDAVLLAEHIRATTGEVDLTLARELVAEEVYDDEDIMGSPWEEHTPEPEHWTAAGLPGRPEEWIARLEAACGPWFDEEDGE